MRRRLLAAVSVGLALSGLSSAQSPPPVPTGPGSYAAVAPQEAAAAWTTEDVAGGPGLWATGEYLVWYTRSQSSPLLGVSVPAGVARAGAVPSGTTVTPLFPANGQKIEFDAQSGVRGRIGTTFGTVFGVDLGGFVLDRQSTGIALASSGTPSLALPYTRAADGSQQYLFSALPGQFGGQLSIDADTQLWGVDGNLRIEWYRLFVDRSELLTGLRYVNLKETLQISDRADLPGGVTSAVRDSFKTQNQFYGAQAGFHARLFGYRGASVEIIDTFGLGGVRQQVTIDGSNSLTGRPDEATGFYAQASNRGTHTQSKFAAMNEGTINLGYDFTPHIRAHVGYSIFWLSSVVRPASAVDTVVNDSGIRYVPNPPSDTNNNRPSFNFSTTDFWAQGVTVGLTFQF